MTGLLDPKPDTLFDAEGKQMSRVLLEHARSFTMQYLHHTIHGTPMEEELVEGRFLGQRGKASAVPHHPSELIKRPTYEEGTQYGYLSGDTKKLKLSAQADAGSSDYLDKYFRDHYLPARDKGLYKDIFDAQRAAVMMAMERVLDSVQSRHADDFAEAQRELEKVVAISIRIVHPQLIEAGLKTHQVQRMMESMYDEAVAQAIRNRIDGLSPSDQQKFWNDYEAVLSGQRMTSEQPEPGLWHRQEAKGEDTGPAPQLPKPPYRARVRLQGQELLDRGPRSILVVSNDNERDSAGPAR